MPTYKYVFGFESPRQLRNNDAHGWDDEDSQCILVDAEDEAAALAWGQEISEAFVKRLFKDDAVSWRELGYANWVELPSETRAERERVPVGTLPDFRPWLRAYESES